MPGSPAVPQYDQQPYAQPYAQQPWSGAPAAQGNNGLALAAMIVGILAIPSACCAFLGIVLGAAGAIMGHISMKQITQTGAPNRGMALTGIICGYVAVGLGILNAIAGVVLKLNNFTF